MADRQDFEKVALVHMDAVFRTAVALCGAADQAEDLTQQTFLKAWTRFSSFKAGTNCRAWLLRITRNLWIDQLRHRKVTGSVLPLDEHLVAKPDAPETTTWTDAADLLENFSDAEVIAALAGLPDDQRLTLFLVDVERMSQEQVARVLGVAVGTVKSRTSRARAALKEKLASHAKDLGLAG
jgi:RNA polymerase sigma-70 factor (ECF subfamily)